MAAPRDLPPDTEEIHAAYEALSRASRTRRQWIARSFVQFHTVTGPWSTYIGREFVAAQLIGEATRVERNFAAEYPCRTHERLHSTIPERLP